MKKSEIYNIIVDKVSEVCEVNRECMVMHKKFQSAVEGRIIAVQYLKVAGLSSDDIALFSIREKMGDQSLCPPMRELKKRSKTIDNLYNSFESRNRESFAFSLMALEVKEFCRERYGELYKDWMKNLPNN